jgi:hypothetical protein
MENERLREQLEQAPGYGYGSRENSRREGELLALDFVDVIFNRWTGMPAAGRRCPCGPGGR